MLEDADFSEIEAKVIAKRLDTLRKAGIEYKRSPSDVLKRIGDKEYYDEREIGEADNCSQMA